MRPLISVIVPVYNIEKYLHRCVDSIINQTYENLEIILVDDGSPDNCGKLCDEYAIKDSRVKVIHQENSGAPTARNKGIDIAKGEYIAFVDSDDWAHPQMLEILQHAIEKYGTDISVCDFYETDNVSETFEKIDEYTCRQTANTEIFEMMLDKAMMTYGQVLWNKLFKKEKIADIRMTPEYLIDDFDFVSKVMHNCKTVTVVDKKMYYYYFNKESVMHSSRYNPKKVLMLEAIYNMAQNHKKHGHQELYKKTMGWCSKICVHILTIKCFTDEIQERKWIDIVLLYLKKCFLVLCFNKEIWVGSKIVSVLAIINFNFAKRVYNLKHRKGAKI